jgi:hypothetical protein
MSYTLLPYTDISLYDIATNSGSLTFQGTDLSLTGFSYYSVFAGPAYAGTVPYLGWGFTEAGGTNRIYGSSYIGPSPPFNYKISDYRGLQYYYDGTTFQAYANWSNSCPPPITPPDTPDVYDFRVRLQTFDSSYTYEYNLTVDSSLPRGATFTQEFSQNRCPGAPDPNCPPLINTYYWIVTVDTSPTYPGVAGNRTFRLDVNGFTYVNATISNGSNAWNSAVYGSPVITAGYPTSATGSTWSIQIS